MLLRKLQKGDWFAADRVEAIITSSLAILDKVGLRVPDESIRERLKNKGYRGKGDRLLVSRDRAAEYLENLRNDKRDLLDAIAAKAARTGLCGALNGYTMHMERDGARVPFTRETLAEQARLTQKLRSFYPGLLSTAPGYPSDVPPGMESVAKYAVSLRWCDGERLFEPTTVKAAEYLFEMAAVAGERVEILPVYPISPLCYGGEALDIVLANARRLRRFYVFSIPNVGVATPMSVTDSLAVTFAEVLASALFTHELTGLPAFLKPEIFPFDLRAMSFAYGSPEKFVYEAMSADFLAQALDCPVDYHSTNVHVLPGRRDAQAAAQRAQLMTAGALLGATKFYCVGALSLDEIFDIRQLVIDMEILDHVRRLLDFNPAAGEELAADLAERVAERADTGFLDSDETLDNHADYLRPSRVFGYFNHASLERRDIRTLEQRVDRVLGEAALLPEAEFLSPEQRGEIGAIEARALAGR